MNWLRSGYPESKPDNGALIQSEEQAAAIAPPSRVVSGPAQDLDLSDASVDVIVFDPPYHNNVNYAELSDYFYVWLKRTAGYVFPEYFQPYLTDKVNEVFSTRVGIAKNGLVGAKTVPENQ